MTRANEHHPHHDDANRDEHQIDEWARHQKANNWFTADRLVIYGPAKSKVTGYCAGLLHRFFMVPDQDRDTRAQDWRYPGTTGQSMEEHAMMGSYGNGMGSLGWLGMGLFWLLLLGLIVWLVRRLLPGSNRRTPRPAGDSAVEILDRRMANGEIDVPAWHAQRAALQGTQDTLQGTQDDGR